MVTIRTIGTSLLIIPFLIFIGFITELIPRTNNMFAMQEPIIFPSEMPVCSFAGSPASCMAAPTDIENSGALVPKPTSKTDMIKAEMPRCAAVFDVPPTSASDPFHSNITPNKNIGIDSNSRPLGSIVW